MQKKVLITGGGKRIGAALAKAFAENDWQVCIHVNKSAAEASELISQFKNPDRHTITQCDFNLPGVRQEWLKNLGKFDLIVSNPPYITSLDMEDLPGSVRDFEPHLALHGGNDGLDFYRSIAENYKAALRPGGYLCFEFWLSSYRALIDK